MSARRRFAHANGNGQTQQVIDHKVVDARTDISRWRLQNIRGVQRWHYLATDEEVEAWPMSAADKYFLGLDTVC